MSAENIIVEGIYLYPLMFFLGLAVVIFTVKAIVEPSRSKTYRQDLSNMYVAGKIKQIAKKEDINLSEEFLEFARITKNKKIDLEALDTTVERELQEKISGTNPLKKGGAVVPAVPPKE